MGDKTLGGIGRLFINDKLLTEVYYCVRQDRPNAPIYGSIVFLTAGIEVPNDTTSYKLYFEDNRCYIILSLFKDPTERFTPYSCIANDGTFYPTRISS
jgi:hypothetical protein